MIKLVPMTELDFQAFLAKHIPEYAADKVQAGNWTEAESLERARQDNKKLLPQGIHTPGQFLNKLVNESGEVVGYLWYARQENSPGEAFIFDFEIFSQFRRRGYASQSMIVLKELAKTQGFKRLALHVFGSNTAARDLYKKSGFIETNVNMAREI